MPMSFGSYAGRVVATAVVATDGSGDFTDIQDAIDSLPAGGGVVYIKEGTYTLTAGLVINVSNTAIIGAGKSTRIVASGSYGGIYADTLSGLKFENLYLQGKGSVDANNIGIELFDCEDSFVSSCWIEQFGGKGILGSWSVERVHIIHCIIKDNYAQGIYLVAGSSVIVTNCTINENASAGITLYFHTDAIISNNFIENNSGRGIELLNISRATLISNNQILGNGIGATLSGVYVAASGSNNIIENNKINYNTNYGVNISAGTIYDTLLVGNHLSDNTVGAYTDSGTRTQIGHNMTT